MKLKTKPNGMYFLDVELPDTEGNLKRTRVSFDTREKAEADHQLRLWKIGTHPKHPNQGRVIAPKGRRITTARTNEPSDGLTIAKLLDRVHKDPDGWGKDRSQATVRSNIKLLCERVGDLHPSDMTYLSLLALRDEMLAEGAAMSSVKRKLLMLSKAFRIAATRYVQDDGVTPLIPARPEFPDMDSKNKKDRVLTSQEEAMVFACIAARQANDDGIRWWRFHWFIRTLIVTGVRRSEALRLGPHSPQTITEVDHLSQEETEHTVLSLPRYSTKNDKPREVPLAVDVVEAIPELNKHAKGGRWFPLDSTAWPYWNQIRKDCKANGVNIDDVGLHTLRHTCLTRMCRSGRFDLHRISLWAGHSSIAITADVYGHLLTQDLLGGLKVVKPIPSLEPTNPAYKGIRN